MVNTGYGQLLINGEWIADVIYTIISRPSGESQRHQGRFAVRRSKRVKPPSLETSELVCADGMHYQIHRELGLGTSGSYIADLTPLSVSAQAA